MAVATTFDFALEVDPDLTTLTLIGELDMYSAEEVRGNIDSLVPYAGRMEIDCSLVTFIDSIGIASLIHMLGVAERRGVPATVRVGTPVARFLDAVGLLDRLPLAG
jgi:anti-anti-sigma factor